MFRDRNGLKKLSTFENFSKHPHIPEILPRDLAAKKAPNQPSVSMLKISTSPPLILAWQ